MTFGQDKRELVRRLVLADILARPGEGPLAPRFPAPFQRPQPAPMPPPAAPPAREGEP